MGVTRRRGHATRCRRLGPCRTPENLIQQGETVTLDLRPHWWYFSRNILTGIPLTIILIVVLGADADWVSKYGGVVVGLVADRVGGVARAEVPGLADDVLRGREQAVIYRSGVVSKRGVEIPLERINNINFHQRLIDRVIGAGDLDIESAGKDGQSHFDFIRHPDGVQHEIYRQMETRNMPVAMMQQAPPHPHPHRPPRRPASPEQIEQLAKLREAGRITAAEFEQKKSELLGRM